jgi:hypothetical protein
LPKLIPANYECTSEEDDGYNCIAWAYGIKTAKMWPNRSPEYIWPPGIRNDETVDAFVELFSLRGYEPCDDASLEPGFEKVAIFAAGIPPNLGPKHAAIQLENGHWSSKLGDFEDIEHFELESVECWAYGTVVRVMRRQRDAPQKAESGTAETVVSPEGN